MGLRGPIPNSIKDLQKTGSYRPGRYGKDGLPVERPEMPGLPGDMTQSQQAFWSLFVDRAEFAGYLARIDGAAIRLAAESWLLYLKACEAIRAHGLLVTEDTKFGTRLRPNPAVGIRNQAWAELLKILDRFGMSPRMRTGLTTDLPDSDDEEELARKVFGGGVN